MYGLGNENMHHEICFEGDGGQLWALASVTECWLEHKLVWVADKKNWVVPPPTPMPIAPKHQPETAPLSHPAHADPGTWAIIHKFALSDATLPQVHASLEQHLGTHYITSDWNPALNAIMAAEGNVVQATEAIDKLSAATCMWTGLVMYFLGRCKYLPWISSSCSCLPCQTTIRGVKECQANHIT